MKLSVDGRTAELRKERVLLGARPLVDDAARALAPQLEVRPPSLSHTLSNRTDGALSLPLASLCV
jgi:hypothetical protein